ncbi:MAG: FAD-binding oxidoreductase [Cereibacter sphaeroides]|uniref:FAD-binding oxidoreductase n=1 Tax=Cereibacter sphaeroides TaxID=1063 RepID=A0A2W5SD24_CERSP|nr:MAG: FAD-binding oxidoreductase [Cereibacter sphaeroides]
MDLITELGGLIGKGYVLTGPDMDRYVHDWTEKYTAAPIAVARPGSTAEVAAVVKATAARGVAVVPSAGRTGLVGGSMTKGGLMVSVDRLNRIREIRSEARLAVVEAGVILSNLHEAADAEGLNFPLWFGARGSAMIGGVLSTNAGGSNVLRFGSTRSLCLGLEVVLGDGRVLNLMSELHKDNSGYDLKQLFIGAEGTLGIITAAVMKLVPKARAHATATLAARSLRDALTLLNRLQAATGGLVEAFEFMPRTYMNRLSVVHPELGQPFADIHDVTILVELGASAPREAEALADGSLPLVSLLQDTLAEMMEEGLVLDAVFASTEAQRRTMWARREAAAELTKGWLPAIDTDVAVPLTAVDTFVTRVLERVEAIDPGAQTMNVAHLGDGNLHFTVFPTREDEDLEDRILTVIEDTVQELGGSFSAEHGVGLSKKPSMLRRKDKVALDVMRAVKAALDPSDLMNPGKILPMK